MAKRVSFSADELESPPTRRVPSVDTRTPADTGSDPFLFGFNLKRARFGPAPANMAPNQPIRGEISTPEQLLVTPLRNAERGPSTSLGDKGKGILKESSVSESRIKVHMQGVAVGRAIYLTNLNGYNHLISELEKMFEIAGQLRQKNKWEILFSDNEGNMMLMGDHHWRDFCKMAKRILIRKCTQDPNVKK